ncbi:mersacidin/lichenicidin family type 2 lantibiotic [Ktedonospora formicarum]|uniref:Mersacidin/lichenicidin family type 2 lantibiotic n=1 Tax=Ktedonospora formicarum TaxID=2778364 RepID=A0A8J3MRV1_9CHLR|nr:mersacidin/lichenicidin family type 2 lantibiotic [Ktedonospora formicarum]GHO45400.1 hypothetical protein KSX_35630 [Ktedonospora formicarum]
MKGNIEMQYDIVRAWKDEEYRQGLSQEQQEMLPESPAGIVDLGDDALDTVSGGCGFRRGVRDVAGLNHEEYYGNISFNGTSATGILNGVANVCAYSLIAVGSCNYTNEF